MTGHLMNLRLGQNQPGCWRRGAAGFLVKRCVLVVDVSIRVAGITGTLGSLIGIETGPRPEANR